MKTLATRSDFDSKFSEILGVNLGFKVAGFRVLECVALEIEKP